jgi:hypothetical protein
MSWDGVYDREYFAGDAGKRQMFADQSKKIADQQIRERIRMGTMASSPQALAKRVLEYQIKQPYPKNSTGSRIIPFESLFDQSWKPLTTAVEGGVKDFRYAQHILKQRFDDLKNQELEKQGMPPVMPETLQLTEVESSSLELDNLLTALDDAIVIGNVGSFEVNDLKNIVRLIVRLSPSFDEDRLAQLIQYFRDLVTPLEENLERGTPQTTVVLEYVRRILQFLERMMGAVNMGDRERQLAARAGLDIFKLFKIGRIGEAQDPDQYSRQDITAAVGNAGPRSAPPAALREIWQYYRDRSGSRVREPATTRGMQDQILRMRR